MRGIMGGTGLQRRLVTAVLSPALVIGGGGLALAAAAPARAAEIYQGIDGYPTSVDPVCLAWVEQPGTKDFRNLILATNGGSSDGIHACTGGEHGEGRAWDWKMNASSVDDRAKVDRVLEWLLRSDERGNAQANARRLGLEYIIWNRREISLSAGNDHTWVPYDGTPDPHTNHVHFSFSWPGARRQTSWWTARAKTPGMYLSNRRDSSWETVTPFAYGFGASTALAGDWDGDGRDTLAVHDDRAMKFYLRNSNTGGGANVTTSRIGDFGDIPYAGDWDGDGRDELGVYRPGNRTFYFLNGNGTATVRPPATVGNTGDRPLVGNFDGDDANDEIGVYHPSNRTFYLLMDDPGVVKTVPMGNGGDIPLVGDWEGDGTDGIGVFRPANHTFYFRTQPTALEYYLVQSVSYGASTDTPVVGDWDGTGGDSQGVARLP